MTQAFNGLVSPVAKSTIPGTVQRLYKREGSPYLFLETTAGSAMRYQTHIFVMLREKSVPIFGMHIVAEFDTKALVKHSIIFTDVRRVVIAARLKGFEQTTADIAAGNENYSFFRIPGYTEPAPVGKTGEPGMLRYSEDIDDRLDHFGGSEEVGFRPQAFGGREQRLFHSQIQGGRL
ncbi:MAG: hypothetical protein AAB668_01155 [Patescibacteria group bacterium]